MGRRIERLMRLTTRLGVVVALSLLLMLLGMGSPRSNAQPPRDNPPPKDKDKDGLPKGEPPAKSAPPKLGLHVNDPRALQGYTVIAGLQSTKTYLIDIEGRVVRQWESKCGPASCAYLLENGHLLRPGSLGAETQSFGGGPAPGGRVQEFDWEGNIVWDFRFFNDKQLPHHDITRMPNGNILMVVWDKKTPKEALDAGRRPDKVGTHLLPDSVIEVKPTGRTTGEVVWEWHLWDHLVQDHDKTKANYGNVAEHPELVDVNYGEDVVGAVVAQKGGADKLKAIGYVGANTNAPGRPGANADWTHVNAIAYNPELDQVILSVHSFSEIWILDHGTTTAEAAGHTGGKRGKGGDLLYRWGNPRTYRAGTKADQRLFSQHNAHWIPKGLPGEGHVLVFNNGNRRPDGNYSSVDEFVLPLNSQGTYDRESGKAYGPDKPVWSYTAPKKTDFFSNFISGVHRLPNGNTFICSGANGTIFEVTPAGEIVWKYLNPVKANAAFPGGGPMFVGPGGPTRPGQVLPGFLRDMLKLTDDQKKQLDVFQKEVDDKLDKALTDEQRKQFREPAQGPGGFAGMPQPGQLMSPTLQARLKLSAEQKDQVTELQKEIDGKLDQLLTAEQKKQFKETRQNFARGGPGMFAAPGGPRGPGGPPGGIVPPGGSSIFRAYRFAANYPGLAGKDLTPGKLLEELQPKEPEKKGPDKKDPDKK
jgi:hypothetical protein